MDPPRRSPVDSFVISPPEEVCREDKRAKALESEPSVLMGRLKFFLIWLLLFAGIWGNQTFVGDSLAFRVLMWIVLLALAVFVFSTTLQGKNCQRLVAEASLEWHKIVWPSRQEAMQMAIMVTCVVVMVSLLLWVLDTLLLRLIGFFI